ncbi:MAG: SEC-C domain-containing protein [Bryobacteraceae bacterium]|nr:SEC-C domain-containing protein [Bryobacteraceae bacterium]
MPANNQHELSPQQRIAIHALATGSDVTTAAAQAGIHRTTLHTWTRTLPAFRAALRQAHANHAEALQDQLRNMSNSATAVLKGILENEKASESVRLRAALAVIRAVEATHPDRGLPATADYERFMNVGLQAGLEAAALQQAEPEPTPRNAPCPCGSGAKFKRCCGASAPPVLHNSSQFITTGPN